MTAKSHGTANCIKLELLDFLAGFPGRFCDN